MLRPSSRGSPLVHDPSRPMVARFLPHRRLCAAACHSAPSSFTGLASQTLTVLSRLAEARRRPAALQATLETSWVCPLRVRASRPLVASQTLTVLSRLAEARRRPSALQATLKTPLVCPLKVRASRPLAASQTLTVLSRLAE